MRRSMLVVFALAIASCGTDASTTPQPEGLAMVEPADANSGQLAENSMVLVIDGDRFELAAGICNTYDNGTFRFALAEGALNTDGQATATIERFNTGGGYDVTVAVEGRRIDGSAVSWYARDTRADDDMTTSIIGGTLEGTARFTESRDDPFDNRVVGNFAVRCTGAAQSPSP